jgi:radical SAM protein with 4Fe4S-binding SPASM domain
LEAAIITTYRCQGHCRMCHIWKYPTLPEEEFRPDLLEKLPRLSFCNVTGGEPFLREDIEEIVAVLRTRARRIVISTNGFLTGKILSLAARYPRVGIRVSLEGLPAANDALRGVKDGFDRGLRTLLELKRMGIKDIGVAITVSDANTADVLPLFRLADALGLEFATAAVHNSFYFHKGDNAFQDKDAAAACFRVLSAQLLASRRPKNWFRAYFNSGLADYVLGRPRPLPCGAARDLFFLDPTGEVLPCNGLEQSAWFASLGNLKEKTFEEIWHSERAERIRAQVDDCPRNCWMIGTAGPAMKKHLSRPALWVLKRKLGRRGRAR